MGAARTWTLRILAGFLLLILLLGVVVLVMFTSNQKVTADVVDKECYEVGEGKVTVKTRLFGIRQAVGVDREQCLLVQTGSFVEYYLRTQRTIIYEREGGACLWDTEAAPPPCG